MTATQATQTTLTAESFAGTHHHPGARKEMADYFASRGRTARGAPRLTEAAGGEKPSWLRGRGAIVWQDGGPCLVVHGTFTREGDRGHIAKMVVVPVVPDGSAADRAAEQKYLEDRLRVVGADDMRSRAEVDAEAARIHARLAELKGGA
jgi:hypothetical protein